MKIGELLAREGAQIEALGLVGDDLDSELKDISERVYAITTAGYRRVAELIDQYYEAWTQHYDQGEEGLLMDIGDTVHSNARALFGL
jgi:hypothetical protein